MQLLYAQLALMIVFGITAGITIVFNMALPISFFYFLHMTTRMFKRGH